MPLLTDVREASFKGVPFLAILENWDDTRRYRGASHVFVHRDGGTVEDMGREQFRHKMQVVYSGPEWRSRYLELVQALDAGRKGLLVHPLFGQIRAFCEGYSGARVVPGQELDTIVVPLEFVEDQLDQSITAEQDRSVAAKAQRARSAADDAVTGASGYNQATQAQAEAIRTETLAYVDAVESGVAISGGSAALVDGVRAAVAAYAPLVRAQANDADAYAAIVLAERALAAALELESAYQERTPQVTTYTVPALSNVATIAAALYGGPLARQYLDDILTRNVIPNPAAIPAGTELQIVRL
jgi:hypothetical protein